MAVNNGQPIGENAYTTSGRGVKRGVVTWNGKELICRRINSYKEIPNMVWGISGVMLLPNYDRYIEDYLPDIYRRTHHTIIGFDAKNTVYLIVRTNSTMEKLVQVCRSLNLVGAVSLDGGGSSQLNYNGKGFKSNRIINSAILIKE